MHDSQRYRDNAADCLLVAQDASQPYSSHGSRSRVRMRQLTICSRAGAYPSQLIWFGARLPIPSFQGTGYRLALGREGRAA
jgi:hypothetical protein